MRWLPLLLIAGACAATREGDSAKTPSHPPPLVAPIPEGSLHRTSRETDFQRMADDLAKADVVYVGEQHDNADHHAIELRIVEELAARGRLQAIGMEMFQRPFQGALDDYVAERIDEAQMLERTEWKKRWGYDYGLYRPLLEFARKQRIRVVALNVSDEIRKGVREGGLEALSEEQRRTLPVLYTEDKAHRDYIHSIFLQMHKDPDEARFESFYTVMCLWDDVMADSVVQWFRVAPKDAQIVVIAGGGHIANRHGIPARAFRRDGRPYATVMPVTGEPSAEALSRTFADFLWVTAKK